MTRMDHNAYRQYMQRWKDGGNPVTAVTCPHCGQDHEVPRVPNTDTMAVCPNCDERRVRKLVTELRGQGEHICADPRNGYYLASNDEELDQTCRFLHDRAMTSLTQISAMKRVSLPDLAGQLRIRMEESK